MVHEQKQDDEPHDIEDNEDHLAEASHQLWRQPCMALIKAIEGLNKALQGLLNACKGLHKALEGLNEALGP